MKAWWFVCLGEPARPFAFTPSSSSPLCCLQQATTTVTVTSLAVSVTLPLLYDDFHAKICAISPRRHSRPPLTAHRYFLYFTDCKHLFPYILVFPRLRNPSVKALRWLIISSSTTQLPAPRWAFFNPPERTTTRLSAHISLVQTGGHVCYCPR